MTRPGVDWRELLVHVAGHATSFLEGVAQRPVGVPVPLDGLRAALPAVLPREGLGPAEVIDELVTNLDAGVVASTGPRYFGYVVGGAMPAALAADWLTSTWDQQAGVYDGSPAAAAVEITVRDWLIRLFGLPSDTSVGFVTGAAQGNFASLCAARWRQLNTAGWDVDARGLFEAPRMVALVSAERHVTIDAALRHLGLGRDQMVEVDTDAHGRMRVDSLRTQLRRHSGRPVVVCAQAGNVNTGATDPLRAIGELSRAAGAWVHVDGAFGMWARTSPSLAGQLDGLELATSWATDAHKWLNVPYDSGIVAVADAQAHAAAMRTTAAYSGSEDGQLDGGSWVPEFSRRARGFSVYAALRSLGTDGLAALVERDCHLARRFAAHAAQLDGVTVLNDVVLNQVLLGFAPGTTPGLTHAATHAVIDAVQREGVFWAGRSQWHSRPAMRVSISGWSTTEGDIDAAVASLARAVRATDKALRATEQGSA